jgi:hypothetical protein
MPRTSFGLITKATTPIALAGIAVLPRLRGLQQAGQLALAQIAGLVEATVEEAEVFARDLEDDDRPPRNGDELATPRRDIVQSRYDMFRHQASP